MRTVRGLCLLALECFLLSGEMRPTDNPYLMPYYTGLVYPTPKSVQYRDEFYSLQSTGIVLGEDVVKPEPLVGLLVERIEGYGGSAKVVEPPAEGFATLISLGKTELWKNCGDAPDLPRREKGYIIHATKLSRRNVVFLKGFDRDGLLWAVASFNQLVHNRGGGRWCER